MQAGRARKSDFPSVQLRHTLDFPHQIVTYFICCEIVRAKRLQICKFYNNLNKGRAFFELLGDPVLPLVQIEISFC